MAKKLVRGNKYRLNREWDAFICGVGRVYIPKGTEFKYTVDGRIYFLNSRKYLPSGAVPYFLSKKDSCVKIVDEV